MKGFSSKLALLLVIGILFFVFNHYGLSEYFTLSYIQSQKDVFSEFYTQNQFFTIGTFFLIYVLAAALSLPGAAVLTLLSGALFGFAVGTIVVSFSSTIGATLAFLISRLLLRDSVEKKFKKYIDSINQGIKKDGAFYLFTLRLIPIFPFFIINLVMGVTSIRTLTYFLVSQIGMLPGTMVYVNAGLRLSELESLGGILSFKVLSSFALLGIFPFLAKKFIEKIKAKKFTKGIKNQKILSTIWWL